MRCGGRLEGKRVEKRLTGRGLIVLESVACAQGEAGCGALGAGFEAARRPNRPLLRDLQVQGAAHLYRRVGDEEDSAGN